MTNINIHVNGQRKTLTALTDIESVAERYANELQNGNSIGSMTDSIEYSKICKIYQRRKELLDRKGLFNDGFNETINSINNLKENVKALEIEHKEFIFILFATTDETKIVGIVVIGR